MTTKIFSALAGLILLFAVAAPLQAVSILNHEMTVIVPFEFVAGDRVLAAGDYTVQINIERGSVVLRGEGQGQRALILLTTRKESRPAPVLGKLVFRRYGTSFFLAEVWGQNNAIGATLAPSSREKELARKEQPQQILVAQAR